jgi:RNA polymerase sigma factor (TIGR02999 family)
MGTEAHDSTRDITQLLIDWGRGDRAALDALAPRLQQELHRLASHYMAGERPGHVLQATALVNEAYLRLVEWQHVQWNNRAQFFGVAAQIMRRVLVDVSRSRQCVKRGGKAVEVSLSEAVNAPQMAKVDVIALDDALKTLEELDPRQCRVIELRFFGGLSLEETAEALQVSVATVRRDWSLARAWLFRELGSCKRAT